MSARTQIADLLATELPQYPVYRYLVSLDAADTTTLIVQQSAVKPGVSQGTRSVDLTIYIVDGPEESEDTEDALEDALTDVLEALDNVGSLLNISAERVSYANTDTQALPAYAVTVTAALIKEYS